MTLVSFEGVRCIFLHQYRVKIRQSLPGDRLQTFSVCFFRLNRRLQRKVDLFIVFPSFLNAVKLMEIGKRVQLMLGLGYLAL